MVELITSDMQRLNDEYQPALATEARRLAAAGVQFQSSDPISQRNRFTQSLQAFNSGWLSEADLLTRRAWGSPVQSEDGTYSLTDGQCWQRLTLAEAQHASALASANRIDLSAEDYLRAKDRASSMVALYQQPVEFLQEYRLMDPAVKIVIQEAHGVLLPMVGWDEVRYEIERDRSERVGLDSIQQAHDQREEAYKAVEACYAATRALYSTFGGDSVRVAMNSIVDGALVGTFVPDTVSFSGSDALLAWHRGVKREVDYNLYNGNPELRFRFRRVVWGMKRQGDRWIYTG